MRRGSTPSVDFEIDQVDLKNIKKAEITFRQTHSKIIKSGADIVNKLTGAESLIRDCDIVITGEGRMDSQTVNGKAPYKILQLAQNYGKPVIGITGILGDGSEKCLEAGFSRIVPLVDPVMERGAARASVKETVRRLFESESFV